MLKRDLSRVKNKNITEISSSINIQDEQVNKNRTYGTIQKSEEINAEDI